MISRVRNAPTTAAPHAHAESFPEKYRLVGTLCFASIFLGLVPLTSLHVYSAAHYITSQHDSACRELQSHKLSPTLLGTSLSSTIVAALSDLQSSVDNSPELTPRLTTTATALHEAPAEAAGDLDDAQTSFHCPALELSPLSTPGWTPVVNVQQQREEESESSSRGHVPLWSPEGAGIGQLPSSLSELSLTSGFLLEDGNLLHAGAVPAERKASKAADCKMGSGPENEDSGSQECTSQHPQHNHKYTFQVVQVSWGSMDGSDTSSRTSSPCRMTSSLCSHPVTLAMHDDTSAVDADPVWSCACTLSSFDARSAPASTYLPGELQPPTKVPVLRLLEEPVLVPPSADDICPCSSADAKLSPRLSMQLLKRFAQSPRADVAALCVAAADGDAERVKKLIARGVAHTPELPCDTTSHVVTSADIDASATPLMRAARGASAGHVECVKSLLAAGAMADWSLPEGRTALFDAAESGCLLTVKLLLAEGADASRDCVWGLTPLLLACQAFGAMTPDLSSYSSLVDYPGVVQELLSAGADVIAACQDGRTALEYAVSNCDTQIAASLLDVLRRTDACGSVERALTVAIKAQNYDAVDLLAAFPGVELNIAVNTAPALLTAAATGDAQLLRCLLQAGARADCTGHRRETALHVCAAADEEGDAIGVLLCAAAALNARDEDGCTPLMCAAAAGNATAAVELLQVGADMDIRNFQGLSALHIAGMQSQSNVASALLAAGATVDLYSADGMRRTPLFAAAATGCVGTVSVLLAAGASVDFKDAHRATPLLHACRSAESQSNAAVVEVLLGSGAHAQCCDIHGESPLIAACQAGFTKGVRALLVRTGVSALHIRLHDGTTPLIRAAESGRASVVTLLLRAGACAEYQRRTDGMNAVMVAAAGGHDACVQALVASGVHVTDRTCMCMTALHFAALAGNCNIVKRLVKAGAAVDARSARGATPLMLAAEAGFCTVVGELLHSGADPSLLDFYGCSPVMIAARKGNRSVLRKLRAAVAATNAAVACMMETSSETIGKDSRLEPEDSEEQIEQHDQQLQTAIPRPDHDMMACRATSSEYSFGNLLFS